MPRSHCIGRLFGGAALACALLASGCAAPGMPRGANEESVAPAAVQARYDDAQRALEREQFDAARSAFLALSREHPEYPGSFRQLALIAWKAGEHEAALGYLVAASDVCADCAPVLAEIGVLRRESGDFDGAEQAYFAALEADPGYADAHFNLAVLNDLYRQRPRLAVAHYEHYLALRPDEPDAPQIRAWVADLERRSQAAAETAQRSAHP